MIHQIRNEADDLIPINTNQYNLALAQYWEKCHTAFGSSEVVARLNGVFPPRIEYFSLQEDASYFMWRMLSIISEPEAYTKETWKYIRCGIGSCKRIRTFTTILDCLDVTPAINECKFEISKTRQPQIRKTLKNIIFDRYYKEFINEGADCDICKCGGLKERYIQLIFRRQQIIIFKYNRLINLAAGTMKKEKSELQFDYQYDIQELFPINKEVSSLLQNNLSENDTMYESGEDSKLEKRAITEVFNFLIVKNF